MLCACAASAWIARATVHRLEPGQDALGRIPLAGLILVSAVGAGIGYTAAAAEGFGNGMRVVQGFLIGQLLLAGWIDRQTTWVPDFVLLTVLIAASAYVVTWGGRVPDMIGQFLPDAGKGWLTGLIRQTGVFAALFSCASGFAVWLGTVLLWEIQVRLGKAMLTPPDIAALLLPIFLLGISIETALVYVTVMILTVMMQKSAGVRSAFGNGVAVREGAAHLGLDAGQPAVALLSLMFWVLAAAIIVRGPLNRTLAAFLF